MRGAEGERPGPQARSRRQGGPASALTSRRRPALTAYSKQGRMKGQRTIPGSGSCPSARAAGREPRRKGSARAAGSPTKRERRRPAVKKGRAIARLGSPRAGNFGTRRYALVHLLKPLWLAGPREQAATHRRQEAETSRPRRTRYLGTGYRVPGSRESRPRDKTLSPKR